MRLTAPHAVIVNGAMVEPLTEFDESKVDSDELDRLIKRGHAVDVTPRAKKPSSKGGE